MRKHHLLEAIVESASQGILAVDRMGKIVFANQAAATMFGYSLIELIGAELDILLPETARERHRSHLMRYVSAPVVRPMGIGLDLSARRKDGAIFPVEVSLSYIQIAGEVTGIALISDIAVRKHSEEHIARSQKMEVVGRLAGGIAHDFNNMLTIIIGYGRLLLESTSPFDPSRRYVEEIGRAADRAAALTKHLLAFSKHQHFQREVADLNAVVRDAVALLSVATGEHIQVVTDLEPRLGLTLIDIEQFQQALANVIINARDAMPSGGQIAIETRNVDVSREHMRTHVGVEPGPKVLVSISDAGIGMDVETKQHMFEPFFTTKGPDRGTGLGLSTVWATVKNFGGDIWVYSEMGKGTTFKIYLPRVDALGVRMTESRRDIAVEGSETILVVEDEPGVRDLTVELVRMQGFKVLCASDALQAIQLASTYQGDIDVVITDIVMPRMNGIEMSEQLRQTRPNLKFLFMSGYAESNRVVGASGITSDSFIEKPFTSEQLSSRIRAALTS